ncbi:hypothetical protein TcWFU_010158 [Taenia crassiceps]|uniref:Uncharacterized protein n=1 Tax=Taenia crassiceps TaxID=6207 RepID=A0ABR4QIV4_9CEST
MAFRVAGKGSVEWPVLIATRQNTLCRPMRKCHLQITRDGEVDRLQSVSVTASAEPSLRNLPVAPRYSVGDRFRCGVRIFVGQVLIPHLLPSLPLAPQLYSSPHAGSLVSVSGSSRSQISQQWMLPWIASPTQNIMRFDRLVSQNVTFYDDSRTLFDSPTKFGASSSIILIKLVPS